ncbi:BglI family type II restriction endonuclease [Candidatus Magnetominusculus xianensis]|uniref:Type-2 restriction enzyme BglI n=1 Tax=Candidatus Magnetominusculus xianensis TaxID=1748249 RepID=A0ABR5SFQ4_9BACT|nr:BglI family type II restriction endonuclease [Candidatus Magnetominusculus xianensis]KWT84937.1 type-2 restriction enzyme BglI [Candidatus Magnetominusculus xianensis]MBF0404481.1 BglI family type II restriction endonuclease [Nitrospirota bacterium]
MFNKFRKEQQKIYINIRNHLSNRPEILINLENYFADYTGKLLQENIESIKSDYNEASYLYPFWQQYPPDNRGRQPRGDQFPWIEVGEHAIGDKLPRLFQKDFSLRDVGLPTGPDKRFIVTSPLIAEITGFTNSAWLFIDIKSVGPRDDADHTVMSHNQISGDGTWTDLEKGIKNSVMTAIGSREHHSFYCSIPPLYVLSDRTVAPVVILAIKPVYKMLGLDNNTVSGQPLSRLELVSIPNGLLMEVNPRYLKKYPNLLYPGKDDKSKNPLKMRCRISFALLREIAAWRVQEFLISDA